MNKLHNLVEFADKEYLGGFVDGHLLPTVNEDSFVNEKDRLAFLFLQKTTKILHAICALNKLDLGEEAIVLARTIFEYSIRLAYINAGSTDSEINARVRAFIGRGYEEQQLKQKEMVDLKGQGKCHDLIADVEAAAPGQTPLHAEKDWEDFPNEKRMAKELGEPYECDWFFLYWSMSKIAHPTAMNLLATSQIDTNPSGDGERALLVGFTNHYRIAEIVCSALGTPGNALKEHLDLKAKGFLTLANAIPTNGKCKTQFHYKLNGWQRLWAILAIAWAIPVLIFTTTTLPTESELKARWANERVNLIRKLHGQDESLAKYRFRLYGNASDEEIIHGKPAPISEQEEFEFRLRREKEIAARSAPASKNPESPSARSRFDLSTAVPSDDIDALNQKYEPRLAQLSTSQFRIIILGFLAWAIAPIALYLLGLGIRWVYLGFLRDKR